MQKVIRTGHSLALTIPSSFAKALAVRRGDLVAVERRVDRGTLTFHFKGAQQLAISENVFRPPKRRKSS